MGRSKAGGFKLKQKLPKIKEKDLAQWQDKSDDGMCADRAVFFSSSSARPLEYAQRLTACD